MKKLSTLPWADIWACKRFLSLSAINLQDKFEFHKFHKILDAVSWDFLSHVIEGSILLEKISGLLKESLEVAEQLLMH